MTMEAISDFLDPQYQGREQLAFTGLIRDIESWVSPDPRISVLHKPHFGLMFSNFRGWIHIAPVLHMSKVLIVSYNMTDLSDFELAYHLRDGLWYTSDDLPLTSDIFLNNVLHLLKGESLPAFNPIIPPRVR